MKNALANLGSLAALALRSHPMAFGMMGFVGALAVGLVKLSAMLSTL